MRRSYGGHSVTGYRIRSWCVVLATVASLASSVEGAGSSEKTPEETAQETKQRALEEYNRGVKHLERANTTARIGDAAFAYNYRATSDAKARKEYEKAAARLSRAIELDPDMADAYNNFGYALRKLGRFKESLDAYGSAIRIDSTHARAIEYRGETYLAMGDVTRAREDRERLTALKSPYADTLQLAIDLYELEAVSRKMEK